MKRNLQKVLFTAFTTFILILGTTSCTDNKVSSTSSTTEETTETLDTRKLATNLEYVIPTHSETIFSEEVQTNLASSIQKKLIDTKYTLEHPLVYYNPFGTNLRSANIYFTTEKPSKIEYTIHVEQDNIPDFTQKLFINSDTEFTKEHSYQLIGLIPNVENTIYLTAYDQTGSTQKSTFKIQVPEVNTAGELILDVTTRKEEPLTNGLFCVFYGRLAKDDGQILNIDLYDNDGILRSEFAVDSYRTDNIQFIDNHIFYCIDERRLAKVNALGQIVRIYDLEQYEFHHDLVYNKEQNHFLILVNDTQQNTVEDMIISLNLESGEVKEVLDLKDVLPEAYEKATLPKDKEKLDWAHINAIQLINNTDVILSFRELSSIVKVDNIYNEPTLKYILCETNVWEGTSYKPYVYKKIGDFTAQAGQHAITYVAGDSDDEYFLYMFNNNFTYSATRPKINWSNYTLAQGKKENKNSYFYQYKIKETEKTFELVNSFPVPYSQYVSNIQKLDHHYIICPGMQNMFLEYDQNGTIIKEFKQQKSTIIYRTIKYDFTNFWFSE